MTLPNVLYLAPLDGIEFTGTFDGSERISNLPITNDAAGIAHYLSSFKHHMHKIGELRYESLLQSKAFIYLPLIYESEPASRSIKAHEELKTFFQVLHNFFGALWLVKDFGVSFETYLFRPDAVDFAVFPNSTLTNCQGNLSPVGFSSAELQAANTLQDKLSLEAEEQKAGKHQTSPDLGLKQARTNFTKRNSRISKVFSMLNSARITPDLASKIAHYCSCFEILFSTSKEAIARSIGERLALTITHEPEERMRIFDRVKQAYRIRCNVLHGTFLSEKEQASLEQSSTECDDMLRRVTIGMATNPDFLSFYATAKEELVDDYFRRIVFGFTPAEAKRN